MRLFVGIPMAVEVAGQLAAVRARLERPNDGLRWSTAESWHITLQFLGATSPAQFDCVVSGLRRIEAGAVRVELGGLGFFERAGVFFADVRVSPELARLQKEVLAATTPCGFEPEDRPYHPHITLARNRGRENGVRALKPRVGTVAAFAGFIAQEFLLYESFPNAQGSQYEVRVRFRMLAT